VSTTTDHRSDPSSGHDRPDRAPTRTRWDNTWPVKGPEAIRLVHAYLAVVGAGAVIGLILTDWTAPNAITRFDRRVTNAIVGHRTDVLDGLAPWAAGPANTYIKILISTLICVVLLWTFRRWDEAVYVALPLVFEATCFVTITRIVDRPRPDVERLLQSSIHTSFPSGHTAAATVYVAVVVVIWRHNRSTLVRAASVAVFALIALGVVWARLYQGMHYLTDVTAGVVLGATSVVITDRILDTSRLRRPSATAEPADETDEPAVDRTAGTDGSLGRQGRSYL
jgi:undecaprenyl-diphosphatase